MRIIYDDFCCELFDKLNETELKTMLHLRSVVNSIGKCQVNTQATMSILKSFLSRTLKESEEKSHNISVFLITASQIGLLREFCADTEISELVSILMKLNETKYVIRSFKALAKAQFYQPVLQQYWSRLLLAEPPKNLDSLTQGDLAYVKQLVSVDQPSWP